MTSLELTVYYIYIHIFSHPRPKIQIRPQIDIYLLHSVYVRYWHWTGSVHQLYVLRNIRVPECGRHLGRVPAGVHFG